VITIIKGDQKNPLISMASIIAKVERDRWMKLQDQQFISYKFAQHK
jgi:ribonuclease HII